MRGAPRPRYPTAAIAGLLSVLCACAPRPAAQEANASPPRITHWFTMGPLDEQRPMRNVLMQEGWHGVTRRLEPVFEWFAHADQRPRLLVHLPFATEGGGYPMDYDSYLRAREKRLWLTRDFDQAWADVRQRHPDVDVIFYVGAIGMDRHLLAYHDAAQAGDSTAIHAWLRDALASVQPLLDAGGSIAFDAGGKIDPDSPEYQFIELLDAMFHAEARGRRVYIEPLPHDDKPGWVAMPVILSSQFWEQVRQQRVGRFMELRQMRNEVMISMTRPPPDRAAEDWPAWYLDYARQALASTGSVAVDVTRLQQLNVDYQTLVRPDAPTTQPATDP